MKVAKGRIPECTSMHVNARLAVPMSIRRVNQARLCWVSQTARLKTQRFDLKIVRGQRWPDTK